jgi:hypothetical protein
VFSRDEDPGLDQIATIQPVKEADDVHASADVWAQVGWSRALAGGPLKPLGKQQKGGRHRFL